MYDISRVTFKQTVRWPNAGPVDSLTSDMWSDIKLADQFLVFTRKSGWFLLVPWSNIRWVSGDMTQAPTSEPPTESMPENVTALSVTHRKRGRPRKS